MTRKNVILVFVILCLIINISCKVSQTTETFRNYKIISIDSIDNVYIIHAKSKDRYFKIVSEKENIQTDRKKIKIDKSYKFRLTSLFKDREKFRANFDGVDFKGQSILLEKDSIYDIHTSKQLRGLYFFNE